MNRVSLIAVLMVAPVVLGTSGCGPYDSGDTGTAEHGDAAFCEEHQIVEAQCPFCNPGLVESMGQCPGHGVPEAFCYQCNPNLIAAFRAVGDWCAGHDRPESQCYICNPELDPKRETIPHGETADLLPPPGVLSMAQMAQLPQAQPPLEQLSRTQRPPAVSCSKQDLTVRFETPEIAAEAGLQYATVEWRQVSKTVECNASIAYDDNRYSQLAAQVPGVVAEVHRDLGDRVAPGDVLVTITSAHLGAAKASYLQAQAAVDLWERNHARERDLLESRASTERDLLEAETHLAESQILLSKAEQALLGLGLSESEVAVLGQSRDTSARYVITAPFAGVVVARQAALGELVDPSEAVFAIADVSRMWALLDIYETDLREIRTGLPVVLHVDGLPGEAFGGHLTWVSSELHPQTRTLQARAELDNHRGLLRAHMFARATVTVRDRHLSLVVPETAVQWEGCCNVVFVKQSPTAFEPRKVHLGIATGTLYEVLGGLRQGEEIVTQGSFLLKTEILKGSIGAGCCEVHPGT